MEEKNEKGTEIDVDGEPGSPLEAEKNPPEEPRLVKVMGRRIRHLRKTKTKLTQTEFGALLGYSRSMVSAIEQGSRRMELDKLGLAARILGVPPLILTMQKEMEEEDLDLVLSFFEGLENPAEKENWPAIKTLLLANKKEKPKTE